MNEDIQKAINALEAMLYETTTVLREYLRGIDTSLDRIAKALEERNEEE